MTKAKFMLIPILISVGFINFRLSSVRAASLQDMVINEIAWMGTIVSANDEWLELQNLTADEIDLAGWKLTAADGQPVINLSGKIPTLGYFLIERTSDESVSGIPADLIYSGALSNSGEKLELFDNDDNIIDSIDASAGWPAGDNAIKATMERKTGGWQTSAGAGGTPRAENSGGADVPPNSSAICGNDVIESDEDCDDGNATSGDGCSSACQIEQTPPTESDQEQGNTSNDQPLPPGERGYAWGQVVINELISDPADEEEEWVEIYNTGWETVDLSSWTLADGSGAKTSLTGSLGISGTDRFKVIIKPKGNLNNQGDIVILKDSTSKLIDQAAYGDWNDGNLDNNAPMAVDPSSLARRIDGLNSGNNSADFSVTASVTKGTSNIITDADGDGLTAADKKIYDFSSDIIISEILPNPEGDETRGEFIELYNRGSRDVNLFGWSLGDESKTKFIFERGYFQAGIYQATSALTMLMPAGVIILKPGEFGAIYRMASKIALNNSSDSAKLYQPLADQSFETLKFSQAKEGWSYLDLTATNTSLLMAEHNWIWSDIPTPGKANTVRVKNHAPVVDFDCPETAVVGEAVHFDSSDTTDADGDKLTFNWDFGDGRQNTLNAPEHTYLQAGLYNVVLTVDDGVEKAKKEKIIKVSGANGIEVLGWSQATNGSPLIINELLPDPTGSDETGEWIELYNRGGVKINLLNWRLTDGGKGKFVFASDRWLDINRYLLLKREESRLVLNNTGGVIELFDKDGNLADDVKYEKSVVGQSLARTSAGVWQWTKKPTPGEVNQFTLATKVKTTDQVSASSGKSKSVTSKDLSLEEIRQRPIGETVRAKGSVAVLPGILGVQYFYIVGSPGIQIYNYKKDFPVLAVGDYIEVAGEISEVNGEKRIKTKSASDIKILEHKDSPVPRATTCEEFSGDLCGELVILEGVIADRKGSTVYLDDGTEEAVIYIKKGTNISLASIKTGGKMAVTGIVSLTKSGPRLLPRGQDDMVKIDTTLAAGDDQVLGGVEQNDEWNLGVRDKRTELLQYLLMVAGGVIIVLIGWLIKNKRAVKE